MWNVKILLDNRCRLNVKNGIVQLASVYSRSAQMSALLCMCDLNALVGFTFFSSGGSSYPRRPPGASCPRVLIIHFLRKLLR